MARWIKFILVLALVGSGGFAVLHMAYLLRPRYQPTSAHVNELRELGGAAIRTGDVPVAALLLFNDSVIGRGCNTVLRDTNASGHAEVNAVNDAIRSMGRERFQALDHDRSLLLSTFEPCAMCRGMMLENRISHAAFIEEKSLWHWLVQDARACWTLLNDQRATPEHFQDSLFRAHPKYDPATADR